MIFKQLLSIIWLKKLSNVCYKADISFTLLAALTDLYWDVKDFEIHIKKGENQNIFLMTEKKSDLVFSKLNLMTDWKVV